MIKALERHARNNSQTYLKSKHSAALLKGNRVFVIKSNSPRFHAEQAVMNAVADDIVPGSTIIVVRAMKNGTLGSSRPCAMCVEDMALRGVKRVYYTDEDGEIQNMQPKEHFYGHLA